MPTDNQPKVKYRGFTRPEHRGSFIGQTTTITEKVPTGKVIMIELPNGEMIRFKVKETQINPVWVWDGNEWLTAPIYDLLHTRTAPAGTKFPSKNDYNALGERRVRYAPTNTKKR